MEDRLMDRSTSRLVGNVLKQFGSEATQNVFRQVAGERARQDAKWGPQSHEMTYWLAILMEEVGEASKATIEGRKFAAREELLQVAAVAVAIVEDMDRRRLVTITEGAARHGQE